MPPGHRSTIIQTAPLAQAQPIPRNHQVFTRITTEQGLSDLRVQAIMQDHAGFMWFGTPNGLDRYDGYDVVEYRNDPANPRSLSGNFIEDLYEDSSGTIWVSTRSGLNAFDRRTEQFTRYLHDSGDARSLSNNWVRAVYQDRAGVLWVGTQKGLNRFDRASGSFTAYRHDAANPHSLSDDAVRTIDEDRAGVLWIGTEGGLNRFDRASSSFTTYRHDSADPHSLSNDTVYDIYDDHTGTLWIATDGGGLNRFDRSTNTFTQYRHDPQDPDSLSIDRLDCLFEDASGALWIGTFGGGLSVLDAERRTFMNYRRDVKIPTALSEDKVQDITADRSGLIWIATLGGGVNIFNPQRQAFTVYQHDPNAINSLASDRVDTVYEDRDGIVWVGTQDQGLDRFDRRSGQIVHYPPDPDNPQRLGHPFVRAIEQDQTGALWVGTYGGGLYRLDVASGSFSAYRHDPANPHSLSNDTIQAIHMDRLGTLWIATAFGGLNRLDPKTGTFKAYRFDAADPDSLSNDGVWSIDEDQRGNIWIGTMGGGLNRLEPSTGSIRRYQHDPNNPASLADDNIFDIHLDRDGILWAGLAGAGLDRFDPATGTFTHYRQRDGLASDRIVSIMEDGNADAPAAGNLWIATGRGLSKLDQDRKTFHTYGTADGLPLTEYNRGHYRTRSGQLLIGSMQGLIEFDPSVIQDDRYVPPIVFTGFQLANKPVPIADDSPLKQALDQADTIELTYADRVVSFEFAALSYRAPGQNHYRYMLEGFDKGWAEVDATRRQVTYTNLAPGTYVFRVTGSNGSGVWNEAGRAITLIVTPPWWATLWFMSLLLALTVGSSTMLYLWRARSVQAQRRRLETQVAQRTSSLSQRTDELAQSNSRLMELIATHERAEARLLKSSQVRATLLSASQQLVSTSGGEPLPERIIKQLAQVVTYSSAAIGTLDRDTLVIRGVGGFASGVVALSVDLTTIPSISTLTTIGAPIMIPNVQSETGASALIQAVFGKQILGFSCLVVPLVASDQVIGLLFIVHDQAGYFDQDDQQRVHIFANLAAIALENVRLGELARASAVMEERSRIARDMHDAVSQSLFSASLIAEGLRDTRNASSARELQGLEELRLLTRAALAEMRALLLELHPGALTEKPLGNLLNSLCTAFTSRTQIGVALEVTGVDKLEPEVQEMLYRIAQEALNNISKHSAASAARVALTCSPEEVELVIADNGHGFDMANQAQASLGIGIMRERAAKIGAELRIESTLGVGTTITVIWRALGRHEAADSVFVQ